MRMTLRRPEAARARLRDVVTKKRQLEAERAKLTLARNKAEAEVAEAERAIRRAEAAMTGARADVGRVAALALAGGDDRPAAAPGFGGYRDAIAVAQDQKFGAEAAVAHLDTQLAEVERGLLYLPIDDARSEAVAPFLRQTLDEFYEVSRRHIALLRTIEVIDGAGLVAPELRLEIDTLRGHVLRPVGEPGMPLLVADVSTIERALDALKGDADAPLVAARAAAAMQEV